METRRITEGRTSLDVPKEGSTKDAGPGSRAAVAFYNPSMAGTRDVTTLLAAALVRERPDARILDGLCGTGVRGLRMAVEAGARRVTLNDRSPPALALARRNVATNAAEDRVAVTQRDLVALLRGTGWEYIEVDPFGSPIPFVAAAVRALSRDGLLGASATDTAALHGSRPEAARRRYLGEPPPRHAPGWHEAALRFYAGTIVRLAAQDDIGATPVLLHVWDHCLRGVFRVRAGAARADAALSQVRPATLCQKCQGWALDDASCPCGLGVPTGPYWLGPLHDGDVARALRDASSADGLADPAGVRHLLAACAAEADLPPFYVDLHRAARAHRIARLAPTSRLLEALRSAGHLAVVPHSEPAGIKTDAAPETVLEMIQKMKL